MGCSPTCFPGQGHPSVSRVIHWPTFSAPVRSITGGLVVRGLDAAAPSPAVGGRSPWSGHVGGHDQPVLIGRVGSGPLRSSGNVGNSRRPQYTHRGRRRITLEMDSVLTW